MPPLQILLCSGLPSPAEPVDPNRGLRALTQEEVRGMEVWPQGGAVSTYCVPGPGAGDKWTVKVAEMVGQASPWE